MEPADEALMLAYRDGDAAAFEALYTRHKGPLYRFVLRSMPQRAVAEELFQEIWMRVIQARERYTPKARFTTWLYTIAHNRMVDHWRAKGLALVAQDPDDPGCAVAEADPLLQAQGNEALERLRQALEALPPPQREVFLLREEAGLSLAEIAAATGADAEAVKSRLRYALTKLRAAIDG
jgi:RNA polymerase sigma-70 factor (ECF subfamily)